MRFLRKTFLSGLLFAAIVAANPTAAADILSPDAEARKAAFGHPAMVARYGGKYGSRELTNYLNDIGERLATAANDSRWDFHFTILDEPNAIAFCVAGGYIYLSRTMLGLANSEAEVAAVLAHEMAHVIKRHGVRRAEMENAQRDEDIFPDAVAFQLLAREQEIEADILGVKIAAAAGYDPMAQAQFLQTIGEFSQMSNQFGLLQKRPISRETHPAISIRIAAASEAAAEAEISVQPWGPEAQNLGYDANSVDVPVNGMVRRARFLAEINNIIYGPRPMEGLAVGTTFVDARSKFTFELPPGFSFTTTGRSVIAEGPEGASLRFDLQYRGGRRSEADLADYMKRGAGRGLRFDSIEETEIGGMQAAVGTQKIRAEVPSHIYFVAVRYNRRVIFRFQFTVPDSFSETMVERIKASPESLRLLTDREARTWRPVRLEVVTVTDDTTMEALAARMRLVDHPVDWLMALNGLTPGARLQPGQKIKILAQ
jgi:predicted Zn-dependent protease